MFTYFFSLVIIIFEAICCNLFYDVFCKENSRLRKSQKVLLMLSLICCYYLCGLFLSDMLILKMTLVVLAAVIIMSFYFEISTKNNAHYSHCSVEFSAPSNCHSVKIVSSHKVSAFGQIWSTKTSATC